MGALTGNTVQSTYLDLVQLGKSGAGLPSHAGKEAAVYDGSGAQILGRTAVRNWLDPDPGAIAGTWEFSTYGDATQAQLETAGWTFSNCTASVANGLLQLVSGGSANVRAETTVSLAGDFDYTSRILGIPTSTAGQYDYVSSLRVGIPDGVGHSISQVYSGNLIGDRLLAGNYNDNPASGTAINTVFVDDMLLRISRFSGTVSATVGRSSFVFNLGTANPPGGYWGGATASDSSTFTRVCICCDGTVSGQIYAVPFIRRYA